MKQCIMRFATVIMLIIISCTISFGETPYQKIDLGYGKWSKSWFADDFGDPMYDKPYIQTELKNIRDKYSWRFFYICYSIFPEFGDIFQMAIGANGSNIGITGKSATIKIKDSNGNISTLQAPVSNGIICLVGDDVLGFGNLINAGNYTMAVTFHSYLDEGSNPQTWTFRGTDETKDFWKAEESIY